MNKHHYKEKMENAFTKLLLQFHQFVEDNPEITKAQRKQFLNKIIFAENTILSSYFNSHNSEDKANLKSRRER